MITYLFIDTRNRVRSLLRFQEVIRELNQITSTSYFRYSRRVMGCRFEGKITNQGKPSTLRLIVLEFISVVVLEAPSAGLFVIKSAGILSERNLVCRRGRRRGSNRMSGVNHRVCPVPEVFLVKVSRRSATGMNIMETWSQLYHSRIDNIQLLGSHCRKPKVQVHLNVPRVKM